jgi:F-type H+-transporting ATPase subunit a
MAAQSFIYLDHTPVAHALEKIEGIDPSPILHAAVVSIILIVAAVLLNRSLRGGRVMPEEKTFTVPNMMDLAVGGLLNFMEELMGPSARRFLPLIGTTAFFILFSNLLGTIPGFDPPTSNLNTTIACALVIFSATHYVGFKTHGISYLKHFMGPVIWLAPLMFIVEIIGHLARVLSLSFRLFGNMFGDHLLLAIFVGLVPLMVPVVFMGLGLFIAFIQAFVFTLLSIIYITGALEEAH